MTLSGPPRPEPSCRRDRPWSSWPTRRARPCRTHSRPESPPTTPAPRPGRACPTRRSPRPGVGTTLAPTRSPRSATTSKPTGPTSHSPLQGSWTWRGDVDPDPDGRRAGRDGSSTDLPVGLRLPSRGGGPSWHLLGNVNRRERIARWLYSPESRTVRRLPAPLGPPIADEPPGPASVDVEIWTGTDLFRWGGLTPASDDESAPVTGPAGAAYRPPPP